MGKLIITGTGNIGEVTDELPIEVHKAKEGLDFLYLCQGRPFHDSTDLHQIHGDVVFVTLSSPGYGQGPLGPADIRSATRLPPQPPGPPGVPLKIWGQ